MTDLNQKQLLLNQLLTDIGGLNKEGQEKEIEMILDKVAQVKEIEDKEVEEARRDDSIVGEEPNPEDNPDESET